jgi:hypothetical protein
VSLKRLLVLGLGFWVLGCENDCDPRGGTLENQNPKTKTQKQKPKTQNPKPKTQNPKPKTQKN